MTFHPPVTPSLVVAFSLLKRGRSKVKCVYPLDILIRKISLDPIGLHGQGAIVNYIPKFQVATMSLEVA